MPPDDHPKTSKEIAPLRVEWLAERLPTTLGEHLCFMEYFGPREYLARYVFVRLPFGWRINGWYGRPIYGHSVLGKRLARQLRKDMRRCSRIRRASRTSRPTSGKRSPTISERGGTRSTPARSSSTATASSSTCCHC